MVDIYPTPGNPEYLTLPTPPFGHRHDHAGMRDAEKRRETFASWPLEFIGGEELAAAGFFYLRHGDAVECAFCGVQVGRWERTDRPLDEHRKWSPRCPYLRRRQADYEVDAVRLVDMSSYETRLDSFKEWPTALKQTPADLAKAGFYYTGIGDKVICYACDAGLYAWEETDVPLVEHAKMMRDCEHLIRILGPGYALQEQQQRETPPKSDSSVKNVEDSGCGLEQELTCKICYDKPRSILLLPCQHLCACVDCSVKLDKCPICREPFESVIKTIL